MWDGEVTLNKWQCMVPAILRVLKILAKILVFQRNVFESQILCNTDGLEFSIKFPKQWGELESVVCFSKLMFCHLGKNIWQYFFENEKKYYYVLDYICTIIIG